MHGVMPRLQFSTSSFFSEYSSDGDVYTDTSNICDFEDYDYSGKLIMHTVQQNAMH